METAIKDPFDNIWWNLLLGNGILLKSIKLPIEIRWNNEESYLSKNYSIIHMLLIINRRVKTLKYSIRYNIITSIIK